MQPVIIWFRDDLRLADNPALAAAGDRPVLCVFIDDPASGRARGAAARWWLHGGLAALGQDLAARGARLDILSGETVPTLIALAEATKAAAVYWNRRYDAGGMATDQGAKTALREQGVRAESFNGALLREPWTLATQSGTPFRVFTPFWRALRERGAPPSPLPAPNHLTAHAWPRGLARTTLDALELEPKNPDWAAPLRAVWRRGEAGAQAALRQFLEHGLRDYVEGRDRPHQEATSRMSPYLRFGHISPRQLWHAAPAADKFLSELGWREFSYYLLFHSPDLATRNWQPAYDAMAWRHDKPALRAWQRGQTGYPLVDAGMRQLWQTGWMHNRVRMVAASFLIKHLLLDWRLGEAWFWDTLVDADPASNPASWQWVAGSGADAAPYYRIFNPVLQGRKFDPAGAYVRRWVPELAALPAALIHEPWTAKPAALRAAGVRLGQTYPLPIVDHDAARARALTAWQATRALA